MKKYFFMLLLCALIGTLPGCGTFTEEEVRVNGELDPVNKPEGLTGDQVIKLLKIKTEGKVFLNSKIIAGPDQTSSTKKPIWTIVNKSGQKLVILENTSRFDQYCKIMDGSRTKIKKVKVPKGGIKPVYITQTEDEKLIMEWSLGEKTWEDKCVEFMIGQPTDEVNGIECYASSTSKLY